MLYNICASYEIQIQIENQNYVRKFPRIAAR